MGYLGTCQTSAGGRVAEAYILSVEEGEALESHQEPVLIAKDIMQLVEVMMEEQVVTEGVVMGGGR